MINLDNQKSTLVNALYKLDDKISSLNTKLDSAKKKITYIEDVETKSSKYKFYKNVSKVTSFISSILESTVILSTFALPFQDLTGYFEKSIADVIQAKSHAEDRVILIKYKIDKNIQKIGEITGTLCETMIQNAIQLGYHFDERRGFVPNRETQTKLTAQNQLEVYRKEFALFKQHLEKLSPYRRIQVLDKFDSQFNEIMLEKLKIPQKEKPKAPLKERVIAVGTFGSECFKIFSNSKYFKVLSTIF